MPKPQYYQPEQLLFFSRALQSRCFHPLLHREEYELIVKMLIVHLFTDMHFKIGKLGVH